MGLSIEAETSDKTSTVYTVTGPLMTCPEEESDVMLDFVVQALSSMDWSNVFTDSVRARPVSGPVGGAL